MTSSPSAVASALDDAVRDHGWAVATDAARLRATLSDLLGAQADDHRGTLDAIVISVEEGVPADLRDAGREGAGEIRADLVGRLEDWGMASDRAAWVVDTWQSLLPETTATPPPTEQPPEQPAVPTPVPTPTNTPVPTPVLTPVEPTELPPAAADPAVTAPPPTALPAASVAAAPVSPAPLLPTSLPPAPVPPVADEPGGGDDAAHRPERTDDRSDDDADRSRRGRWPWVAAGVALVAVAGTWGALAATGDDPKDTSGAEPTSSSSPGSSSSDTAVPPETLASGKVVSSSDAAPARASGTFAMAGRVGGVRLVRLGPVDQVGAGAAARVAADGDQLVGFTIAKGPCQERPCREVGKLDLQVAVDGELQPLPPGGPTYVVAAPEGAALQLVYAADGFDQRLSLVDGKPGNRNIEVLLRSDRTTRVNATDVVSPTVSNSLVLNPDRTVKVGRAELFFFNGREGLPRADRAYLRIGVTYTRPGPGSEFDYEFYPSETHFRTAGGELIEPRNIGVGTDQDLVFIVPAGLTGGQLILEGSRQAEAGSITYTLTIPRTTFPIRFGDAG